MGVGDKTVHVHTLHDALNDMVAIPKRPVDAPFRMPVSQNLKIKGVGSVICGRIEQGLLNLDKKLNSCQLTLQLMHVLVKFSPLKCITRMLKQLFLEIIWFSRMMTLLFQQRESLL